MGTAKVVGPEEEEKVNQKSTAGQRSAVAAVQPVVIPVDKSVVVLRNPRSKAMTINGMKPKNMSGEMQFQIQINLNLNFDELNDNDDHANGDEY